MRIIKLLEALYLELKIFNENVEYFSLLETEVRRKRENPLRILNDVELSSLKLWIHNHLKKNNVGLIGDAYTVNSAEKFLYSRHTKCPIRPARDLLSAALGYGSFDELLEAWRQSKGGAA